MPYTLTSTYNDRFWATGIDLLHSVTNYAVVLPIRKIEARAPVKFLFAYLEAEASTL